MFIIEAWNDAWDLLHRFSLTSSKNSQLQKVRSRCTSKVSFSSGPMQIFIRSIDEMTKPNFGNLIYSDLAKSLFRSQFKFQIGKATATKRTDYGIILFIPLKQFVHECVPMSL